MRLKDHSRSIALSMGCLFLIASVGFLCRCSSRVKSKTALETLFDEGRSIFFQTVTDEVMHHPKRGTLNPEFEKQWGLDAARFRRAYKLTKGRGVRIAVLDSAVQRFL